MNIKYRVWDTAQRKMVIPTNMEFAEDGELNWIESGARGNTQKFQNDGDTELLIPMQYIGLRDSLGFEIYVGDLVTYTSSRGPSGVHEVKLDKGTFQPFSEKTLADAHDIHVVGNIYESKDQYDNDKDESSTDITIDELIDHLEGVAMNFGPNIKVTVKATDGSPEYLSLKGGGVGVDQVSANNENLAFIFVSNEVAGKHVEPDCDSEDDAQVFEQF